MVIIDIYEKKIIPSRGIHQTAIFWKGNIFWRGGKEKE